MAQDPSIARLRREVDADPASLRFVPLAEALRRAGRFQEAEVVLARGLRVHPGLNSARLVQARVMADTGRLHDALQVLDELYPRDAGNVALVTLYLTLLVEVGRHDEARVLLDRAELVGVPAPQRDQIALRLEAALWPSLEAVARQGGSLADETWPPMEGHEPSVLIPQDISEPPAEEASLGPGRDPFCTPVVATRLERGGRLDAALRLWRALSRAEPRRADLAARVADVQFRLESGAETLQAGLLEPVDATPRPAAGARALLQRWQRALAALPEAGS